MKTMSTIFTGLGTGERSYSGPDGQIFGDRGQLLELYPGSLGNPTYLVTTRGVLTSDLSSSGNSKACWTCGTQQPDQPNPVTTPEPATALLFSVAFVGLFVLTCGLPKARNWR